MICTFKGLLMGLGMVVVSVAATTCEAAVIYFDDFTTPGTNQGGPYVSSLFNTAPSVDNNGGGHVWTTDAETGGWGQTGSGYATPSSSNFLAFTPVQGYTYTLEADMYWTSDPGGDQWMVLVFADAASPNWPFGGDFLSTGGVGDLSEPSIVRSTENTLQHITVTLDTTSLSWTNTAGYAYVGWIMNGAGAGNIGASRIENFSLTAIPVPEPSSLAMLAFGSVSLWLAKRRRSR
jgi:hypothetical protein